MQGDGGIEGGGRPGLSPDVRVPESSPSPCLYEQSDPPLEEDDLSSFRVFDDACSCRMPSEVVITSMAGDRWCGRCKGRLPSMLELAESQRQEACGCIYGDCIYCRSADQPGKPESMSAGPIGPTGPRCAGAVGHASSELPCSHEQNTLVSPTLGVRECHACGLRVEMRQGRLQSINVSRHPSRPR